MRKPSALKFCSLLILLASSTAPIGAQEGSACACAAVYDPVCGNDGRTYSNRGCANCAGVTPACSGECPCNFIACTCLTGGPRVCGVDNIEYGSACFAACEDVEVACEGPCPCPVPDCVCTLQYEPVCGVDQETYSNPCFADCSGVEIACNGECPCPCATTLSTACPPDPCRHATCAAFPNAKCYVDPCGRCSTYFVLNGKRVNCGVSPSPSPRPPFPPGPPCLSEGATCTSISGSSNSGSSNSRDCCPGLECCRCEQTSSSGRLAVSTLNGRCQSHCDDC